MSFQPTFQDECATLQVFYRCECVSVQRFRGGTFYEKVGNPEGDDDSGVKIMNSTILFTPAHFFVKCDHDVLNVTHPTVQFIQPSQNAFLRFARDAGSGLAVHKPVD